MRIAILGIIGMFVLVNCQRRLVSETSSESTQGIEETAISVFERDYKIVENTPGDFALISKEWKAKPTSIFSTLSFVIYDQSKMSIVYKKTIDQGYVKWLNDDQIIFESIPGRSENQRLRYIYNVRTKQVHPSDE